MKDGFEGVVEDYDVKDYDGFGEEEVEEVEEVEEDFIDVKQQEDVNKLKKHWESADTWIPSKIPLFNTLFRTFFAAELSSELGFGGVLMEGFNPAANNVGSEKVIEPEIASLEAKPEIKHKVDHLETVKKKRPYVDRSMIGYG